MTELLVGVDVEKELITELDARMAATPYPVKAHTQIPPNPRPGEFIRVIAAGGAERDLVTDSRTVTLEGWAETETRAERICSYALAVVYAAARAGTVGAAVCYYVASFGLPVNLPHPQVPDMYRYQTTISVDLRKVVG